MNLSLYFYLCRLEKKSTTWELWAKFYLGQNEDDRPGDRISDIWETAAKR